MDEGEIGREANEGTGIYVRQLSYEHKNPFQYAPAKLPHSPSWTRARAEFTPQPRAMEADDPLSSQESLESEESEDLNLQLDDVSQVEVDFSKESFISTPHSNGPTHILKGSSSCLNGQPPETLETPETPKTLKTPKTPEAPRTKTWEVRSSSSIERIEEEEKDEKNTPIKAGDSSLNSTTATIPPISTQLKLSLTSESAKLLDDIELRYPYKASNWNKRLTKILPPEMKQLRVLASALGSPCPRFSHKPLPPRIPPFPSSKSGGKTLILGLERTLMSIYEDWGCNRHRQQKGVEFDPHTLLVTDKLEIPLVPRPHVHLFLKEMSRVFDVIVFSLSEELVTLDIINVLDPACKYISHVLTRRHCHLMKKNSFKTLDILKDRDPSQILVLDSRPSLWPSDLDNLVPVVGFNGWENEDTSLLDVMGYLLHMLPLDDVRKCNYKQIKLKSTINRRLPFHK